MVIRLIVSSVIDFKPTDSAHSHAEQHRYQRDTQPGRISGPACRLSSVAGDVAVR
jgi:hypothetical protein